jgi:hypothetical protein
MGTIVQRSSRNKNRASRELFHKLKEPLQKVDVITSFQWLFFLNTNSYEIKIITLNTTFTAVLVRLLPLLLRPGNEEGKVVGLVWPILLEDIEDQNGEFSAKKIWHFLQN